MNGSHWLMGFIAWVGLTLTVGSLIGTSVVFGYLQLTTFRHGLDLAEALKASVTSSSTMPNPGGISVGDTASGTSGSTDPLSSGE
jgi:hypothetical protein